MAFPKSYSSTNNIKTKCVTIQREAMPPFILCTGSAVFSERQDAGSESLSKKENANNANERK